MLFKGKILRGFQNLNGIVKSSLGFIGLSSSLLSESKLDFNENKESNASFGISQRNLLSLKVILYQLKGVSLKKNHRVSSDYKSVIENQSIKVGKNINLQMQNNKMRKITVNKNALAKDHTKMIVLPNQSGAPFVPETMSQKKPRFQFS